MFRFSEFMSALDALIWLVVRTTPSRILSSAAVDVTPSRMFNSAAVEVTAVPPTFHSPTSRFGLIAVVPSSKSSTLSRFVLILVPQVSEEAPTSGLTREYVVVVESAILSHPHPQWRSEPGRGAFIFNLAHPLGQQSGPQSNASIIL